MDKGLSSRMRDAGVALGAYANRLTEVDANWSLSQSDGPQPHRHDLDPDQYHNEFISVWIREYGVQLVGGCCGKYNACWLDQSNSVVASYT
jgi:methionine synthase I (cobalamin-dependent)